MTNISECIVEKKKKKKWLLVLFSPLFQVFKKGFIKLNTENKVL